MTILTRDEELEKGSKTGKTRGKLGSLTGSRYKYIAQSSFHTKPDIAEPNGRSNFTVPSAGRE